MLYFLPGLCAGELAFEIWKEELIKAVQGRLVSVLLECIRADRRGKGLIAPAAVVRGVIHSLVDVCVYQKKNTYMVTLHHTENELML